MQKGDGVPMLRGLIVIGVFWVLALNASATTCVSDRRFKVKKICGSVVDTQMTSMPDATIQVVDEVTKETKAEGKSSDEGRFSFDGLAPGRYALKVNQRGFWEAWQPIELTDTNPSKCSKPVRVVLSPAGGCSFVQRNGNPYSRKEKHD